MSIGHAVDKGFNEENRHDADDEQILPSNTPRRDIDRLLRFEQDMMRGAHARSKTRTVTNEIAMDRNYDIAKANHHQNPSAAGGRKGISAGDM